MSVGHGPLLNWSIIGSDMPSTLGLVYVRYCQAAGSQTVDCCWGQLGSIVGLWCHCVHRIPALWVLCLVLDSLCGAAPRGRFGARTGHYHGWAVLVYTAPSVLWTCLTATLYYCSLWMNKNRQHWVNCVWVGGLYHHSLSGISVIVSMERIEHES